MLELVSAHVELALHAALLFAVGLFTAWPVVRYRWTAVARPALSVFRAVLRLMGPSPSIARMAAVIFGFNATAIFLYMASGFHPMLPKVFGIWTGLNVAVIGAMAAREPADALGRPRPGQWRPPAWLALPCGLLVLALELPCFWVSLALGMSMGHAVQGGAPYLRALAPRAAAYACVIAPALVVSALAEAVAIRGAARRARLA
jgi:hypothetical protein